MALSQTKSSASKRTMLANKGRKYIYITRDGANNIADDSHILSASSPVMEEET